MNSRKFLYFVLSVALALLPLAGCSGGSGSAGSIVPTEKGVSLTVSGSVGEGDTGKSLAKIVGFTAPDIGDVTVLDAYGSTLSGAATSVSVKADGSFSGLSFTLPATKSVIVFKAVVPSKSSTPFYAVVPIDLTKPDDLQTIGAVNPIVISISQASTSTADVVSSALGLAGKLGEAGSTINPASGPNYTTVAQLVAQYGGLILAYNAAGLNLTGSLKETLLPAQDANTLTGDQINTLTLDGAVTGVSIPGNNPIVSFQVTNKASGKGVRGLKTFAFAVLQLKPGVTGGPDEWLSYMVSDVTTSDATPVTFVGRPSTESSGGSLIDNGDGSYVYKMAKNIKATTTTSGLSTGVAYDANLTHRVAIQVRTAPVAGTTSNGAAISNFTNAANIVYDFVPASGAPVTGMLKREITTTAACNECHTKIGTSTPHGGRVDTRYCVVCHTKQRANGQYASTIDANGVISTVLALDRTTNKFTPSTSNYVVDGQALGNFVTMVHKVHMGSKLTLTGYNYAGVEFNPIVLPQDVTNCRKCHKGDNAGQLTAAPQGNNWQTRPSRQACGACHDNINFATGVNSKSGGTAHVAQTDDANCATCHATTSTILAPGVVHRTINATPNNPNVADGLVNFFYEINSVTVNASNQAVIKFRVQQAVAPATTKTNVVFTGVGTTASPLLTGFTGGPSFLLAYTQDGSPDYTNMGHTGKKAAQPISVSIANLADGTKGTLGTPDANGYYTATITAAASNFPAGATVRSVGLQGYFTQVSPAAARHAVSVQKAVTSDVVRRKVIDSEKCANCHEWFEGHGGNRVKEVQVCIQCHVPNLSTSGKGADINLINFIKDQPVDTVITTVSPITGARYTATGKVTQSAKDTMTALVAAVGSDPTTYPEDSNNMKDMIHGIHAGSSRAEPMQFVRDRGTSGVFYYDWGHVVFPGILKDCTMCHVPVTSTNPSYAGIPTG
ncbi:MAG: OmcA/MtrC family decaheme c-type cytochrome, partial [Deltaproteobacteria bacterium]|nr:OmcA/MtrC family decaheme c-type cytochrome [Deltaproteobacteria bacterium]